MDIKSRKEMEETLHGFHLRAITVTAQQIFSTKPGKLGSLYIYNEPQLLCLPSRQKLNVEMMAVKRVDNKNLFMVANQLTFQN